MEDTAETGLWQSIKNFFKGKSENPIEDVIKEARSNQEIGPDVAMILLNVLKLDRNQVREIMIPRTDIDCVELKASLQEVIKVIIESGHSRIPVYKENRDQIVGIIHAKDILKAMSKTACKKEVSVQHIMRPPLFIPETKNVQSMLMEFQSKKVHLAIAIDEYGGTSGLITFEDVLEEIVGEIEDEYDSPKPEEIKILEDESCLVAGRTTLSDLKEELGIALKSEHVETLGGYLTETAGRVPGVGENFQIGPHTFQIKEADKKQIHWVLLYPVPSSKKEKQTDPHDPQTRPSST